MDRIDSKRFGLAIGSACVAVYLGCVIIMLVLTRDAALFFFNSISHGVDWAPILRVNIPWWEVAVGTAEVFILGWLIGLLIARVYNIGRKDMQK